MKCAVIYQGAYPPEKGFSGADRRVRDIVLGLGASSDTYLFAPRWKEGGRDACGVPLKLVGPSTAIPGKRLLFWHDAIRQVRKTGFDVVVFYNTTFESAIPGLLLRAARLVVAYEMCDMGSADQHGARWWVAKAGEVLLPRVASVNVVISARIERHVLRQAPTTPVIKLPILVDTKVFQASKELGVSFRSRQGIGQDHPVVAYAGGTWRQEGLAVLLEAFKSVAKDFAGATLVIAGRTLGGPAHDDVQRLAAQPGLAGRVVILGEVDTKQILELYSAADILAAPQLQDPFNEAGLPTKLAEYAAMGRAILATRVGDVGTYFTDGENAALCEPSSAEALAAGLRRLLEDRDLRLRLGEGALRTARSVFDSRMNGGKLLARFEELVARSPSGTPVLNGPAEGAQPRFQHIEPGGKTNGAPAPAISAHDKSPSARCTGADVLLVARNLGWGGTECHVQSLSRGLRDRGISVNVLAECPPTPRRQMIESFGVSVQLLGEAPIQDRHRYIQSVARVISSVGAKIVHGHGAQPEWIAAAAKQSGRPCIITHHHTERPLLARERLGINQIPFNYYRTRRSLRNGRYGVISVSTTSDEVFKKKYACEHGSVVAYCGVPDTKYRVDPRCASQRFRIGWCGSLIERKQPFTALSCLERLQRRLPQSELLMIGNGPLESKVRQRASHFRPGALTVLTDIDDPRAILSTCDVFLLTSLAEGLPLVIIEALSLGLPVVTTDVGAVREAVDSRSGIVVKRNDPDELVAALNRLATDDFARAEMGRAARATYEDRFTLEQSVTAILSAYDSLCGVRCDIF